MASLFAARQVAHAFRGVAGARAALPAAARQQRRWLNLHEAYSFQIMEQHGIKVPKHKVAATAAEARIAAESLGDKVVVKAQVLAGGRGKGHFDNGFEKGVHLVNSPDEAQTVASQMIGARLITKQTGEGGRPCNKVLVVEQRGIAKEFYFAILMDRAAQGPVVVASSQGGMDIEAVAESDPNAIVKEPIDATIGLTEEQANTVADKLGFEGASKAQAAAEMLKLYDMFSKTDATLVEINPLVQDTDGNVLCLDAKVNIDMTAGFRQKSIFALRDPTQENALDVEAAEYDLNYIGLDGTIGCLVNGAGLAMATMDIIQLYGGKPANFLDVGGGATAEQVMAAFRIITSDPQVKTIFVNIFGGIMRCDVIAHGIIEAASKLDLKIPIVVRLQGTRKTEARALIAESSLDLISADELDQAAQYAVAVAQIETLARGAGLKVSVTADRPAPHVDGDGELISL